MTERQLFLFWQFNGDNSSWCNQTCPYCYGGPKEMKHYWIGDINRWEKAFNRLNRDIYFVMSYGEAMACGCIPVVTKRAALPEVASEYGIYVPYGDVNSTAQALKRAFKMKNLEKCARNRIVKIFSLEKRERELTEILISLFK